VALSEDTDRYITGVAANMIGLKKLDVPGMFVYFYSL
jgi:hypothetical protein